MEENNVTDSSRRAPLGWDARSFVFVTATLIFAAGAICDMVKPEYDIPVFVYAPFITIVGWFVKDIVKATRK